MVQPRDIDYHQDDGSINPEIWLQRIATKRKPNETNLIRAVINVCQLSGEDQVSFTGESCLQFGLHIADTLEHLELDVDTIAAALLFPSVQYAGLNTDDISEQFNKNISKLIVGVAQMDAIHLLHKDTQHLKQSRTQLDNISKMLLAMVEDVRVVLIKLAERASVLRAINLLGKTQQQEIARETQDIYAPLANRLGIGQIKWQLEDLAFRYLEPDTYKSIAKQVAVRRIDRENFINEIIAEVKKALKEAGIQNCDLAGRAKHIYSIYKKMQRKKVDFSQIYDATAIRVLTNTIENCYAVLGIVHSLWEPIPVEFDDYIANPKPNGYRSLHTAVVGPHGRNVEIQIRTHEMHQESELGIAAHWVYKEDNRKQTGYDQKIAWLRQVIDWQKELANTTDMLDQPASQVFEDRVYVFTPTSEIFDLAKGATPLDFAYHIHTQVGHRCRGAKVNDSIVPLTYELKTGDRIEILTAKHPSPSRDWLNLNQGYLKTPRARAKVHHWFKEQDHDKNLIDGQHLLEHEVKRMHLDTVDYKQLARKFNMKTTNDMYAALGAGNLRLGQLLHAIEAMQKDQEKEQQNEQEPETIIPIKPQRKSTITKGLNIQGVGNLLSSIANCCKPVPGDPIVGYITQGRGVSIHRQDCINILSSNTLQKERMLDVDWGEQPGTYPVDVFVKAYDRHGLVRDIATVLSNEKISLRALNTVVDKNEHSAHITITLDIPDLNSLSKILDRINQLPNVITVERQRTGV